MELTKDMWEQMSKECKIKHDSDMVELNYMIESMSEEELQNTFLCYELMQYPYVTHEEFIKIAPRPDNPHFELFNAWNEKMMTMINLYYEQYDYK
jgi:hypothetical protein|tara:strand:+ start:263 stop:547 length:285 start_codon:yes stop_codon:yes gene_type:complete